MDHKEYDIRDAIKCVEADIKGDLSWKKFTTIKEALEELFHLRRRCRLLEALSITNAHLYENDD